MRRSFDSSSSGRQRTGKLPEELIFDSKLTTYGHLNRAQSDGDCLYHAPETFCQDAPEDLSGAGFGLAAN